MRNTLKLFTGRDGTTIARDPVISITPAKRDQIHTVIWKCGHMCFHDGKSPKEWCNGCQECEVIND